MSSGETSLPTRERFEAGKGRFSEAKQGKEVQVRWALLGVAYANVPAEDEGTFSRILQEYDDPPHVLRVPGFFREAEKVEKTIASGNGDILNEY